VSPYLGGFELANPRGQFGGERFHLACPKLGLDDGILHYTILLQIYAMQEGSTLATGTRGERAHHWGVSSKGGAPVFDESLFQEIRRASTDSSTWVFIAGSWPLDLVHFGGVSCAI
jgi:hypothetical protein